MKYYTICYPDHNELGNEYTHWETLSEEDILNQYWLYWFTNMVEAKRPDFEITPENCIDDWCIVHWAERNYWYERMENVQ